MFLSYALLMPYFLTNQDRIRNLSKGQILIHFPSKDFVIKAIVGDLLCMLVLRWHVLLL